MIQFTCPICGKVISVHDELAGRHGKCSCGAIVRVPPSGIASESRAVSKVLSTPAREQVGNTPLQPAQPTAASRETLPTPPKTVADAQGRLNPRRKLVLRSLTCVGLLVILLPLLYLFAFREKAKPSRVQLVTKLEVLSARVTQKHQAEYKSLIALEATPIVGQSCPVPPPHVSLLIAFAPWKTSAQQAKELLNLSSWDWNSSCAESIPCGVEELDSVKWHIETKRLQQDLDHPWRASFAIGCYQVIRPLPPFTWKLDEPSEIRLPLATPTEAGTVAVCVAGTTVMNEIIRLSEPVVVVLDPEQPDVSVTKRPGPVEPQRAEEMQQAAEKIPDIIDKEIIESMKVSFEASSTYEDSQKLAAMGRSIIQRGSGRLSADPAFQQLLESTDATAIGLVFRPITVEVVQEGNRRVLKVTGVLGGRLSRDLALSRMGNPERTARGLYPIEGRDSLGSTSVVRQLPITWYHWAWLSAAIEEDGSCRELRIDTAARREWKGSSPGGT